MMRRVQNIASTTAFVCTLAAAGLLLLSGCKQPESVKKNEVTAPPATTQEESRPGEVVEVNGNKYRLVDCDCSDEPQRRVDLDQFLDAALQAPDLKKFIAEHMKEKPLCLQPQKKQSIVWSAKSHDFQVMRFVNYADDKDADLFEQKPPFPGARGKEGNSGPIRADAPYSSTEGKCYLFKGYVKVYTEKYPDGLEIDPHIGTGCCR
jgi:hypothetical protein